jgi:hypothetical protein
MAAQPITAEAAMPGPPPSRVVLAVASTTTMAFSLLCWAFVAFFVWLGTEASAFMLLSPLLLLPATIAGSVLAWRRREWLPFYVGTAVSLLPVAVLILASIVFDPAPSSLGAGGMD